jgi:8-oxo-dGTP pyrophosphatase MutT (NUDIX family)
MNDLKAFLENNSVAARETVDWGEMRFDVHTYITDQLPPLDLVTSVKAIVLNERNVMTVRDPERIHILPGGRRERDEELEETLVREILEETGWEVSKPRLLGTKHFHHFTPKPLEYSYPYPDFLQIIYVAEAFRYNSAARQTNGYELSAEFRPLQEVQSLNLDASEQALLLRALS